MIKTGSNNTCFVSTSTGLLGDLPALNFIYMFHLSHVVFTNLSEYKRAHRCRLLWEYLLNIPKTKLLAIDKI